MLESFGFMCEGWSSLLWIPIVAVGFFIMVGPYYIFQIAALTAILIYIFDKSNRPSSRIARIIIWLVCTVICIAVTTLLLPVFGGPDVVEWFRK